MGHALAWVLSRGATPFKIFFTKRSVLTSLTLFYTHCIILVYGESITYLKISTD